MLNPTTHRVQRFDESQRQTIVGDLILSTAGDLTNVLPLTMTRFQLPVTYRPHPAGVLFWLLIATPGSLGMFAVFRWVLEAPVFAQMFIAFLVFAVAVSAIAIAFSYFKVSEDGIESRYFRHAKGK